MKVVVDAVLTVSYSQFMRVSPHDFRQLAFKGSAPEVDQVWYVVYGIPLAQKWAWEGIIGVNNSNETFMALCSTKR